MKLEWFEAQNFCQYREARVEFSPGTTAIIGPNGAGKSNIISGIHLALVNTSLSDGVKEDDISQLAAPGEASSVRVGLTLQGRSLEIRRDLAPSSKHRLQVAGGEALTKADRIAAEFNRLLGFPSELLSRFLFSRQGELFDLLLQTPGQRAKTFQSLLGLDEVEAIYADLGKELASVGNPQPNATPVHEIAAQAKELQERINQLTEEIEEMETRRLRESEREKRQNAALAETQQGMIREQIESLTEELEQARKEEKQLADDVAQLEKDRAKAVKALAAIEPKAKRAATWKETQLGRQQRRQQIQDLKEEIRRWEVELEQAVAPPLAGSTEQADQLLVSITQLREKSQQLEKQIEQNRQKSPSGQCPTCGQKWKQGAALAASLKEWKEELRGLPEQIRDLSQQRARLLEVHAQVMDAERKRQRASAALVAKRQLLQQVEEQARLAGDGAVSEDFSEEEVDQILANERFWQAEVPKTSQRLASRQAKRAAAEAICQTRKKSLARLEQQLRERQDLVNSYPNAAKDLQEDDLLQRQIRDRQIKLSHWEEQKEDLRTRFRQARQAYEQQVRARDWRDKVEAWRGACHPQAVPHLLVLQVLRQLLERSIPEILRSFGNPFQVALDEKRLSFFAIFPDGRKQPATRLSGGQRSILAFAIRLAICQWASNDLGVLILDEPTEGLDADNIQLFRDALGAVRSTAQQRGLQLVVVTHAEEVASVCDRTIEVQPGGRIVSR